MKQIYSLKLKEDSRTKNAKSENPEPMQSSLNFLFQFARSYYVEKNLEGICKKDLILN